MPINDLKKRRLYARLYMRKRRGTRKKKTAEEFKVYRDRRYPALRHKKRRKE